MSYHKTRAGSKDGSGGKIHVSRFHPGPGFTNFVNDSTKPDPSVTSDIRPKLDFSEKILESKYSNKGIASQHAADDNSHPFLGEEFDKNSAAAVSAAALEDAVQKAQKIIRIAKKIMERKMGGLQNRSDRLFKDGLRIKDRKENSITHEGNSTKHINAKAQFMYKHECNANVLFAFEGTETKKEKSRVVEEKEYLRKVYEESKKERQRELDRIAVGRVIQEARDRAFAGAREKAERATVERAFADVRQRSLDETCGKLEKATTAVKQSAEKALIEAKIRSERAAVERATTEARGRALEKALSQKNTSRTQVPRRPDDTYIESAQRIKARFERQERIMERVAKALAEKNMRDLLAQKEEAEKNRLAKSLDSQIKRWSTGKEGNLRALLSTLHYILGPGSGWQPISLADIITSNTVKTAYRKSILYVHPDKLQQRGACIREKYICEKVFDLLKVGWARFNSEER